MTRLVFISDTHNMMDQVVLPEGDILIHSGDALGRGHIVELARFNYCLKDLSFKHILFIPGNHDWAFETQHDLALETLVNAKVLIDESVVIDGIKFYGSPWQPEFCSWAFNLPRGRMIAEKWKMIPDDTDVLITHGPPAHILDVTYRSTHAGCQDLYNRVMDVKPKIHAMGHIHYSYGFEMGLDTLFINASICGEDYRPNNDPIVVDFIDGKAVVIEE